MTKSDLTKHSVVCLCPIMLHIKWKLEFSIKWKDSRNKELFRKKEKVPIIGMFCIALSAQNSKLSINPADFNKMFYATINSVHRLYLSVYKQSTTHTAWEVLSRTGRTHIVNNTAQILVLYLCVFRAYTCICLLIADLFSWLVWDDVQLW